VRNHQQRFFNATLTLVRHEKSEYCVHLQQLPLL